MTAMVGVPAAARQPMGRQVGQRPLDFVLAPLAVLGVFAVRVAVAAREQLGPKGVSAAARGRPAQYAGDQQRRQCGRGWVGCA